MHTEGVATRLHRVNLVHSTVVSTYRRVIHGESKTFVQLIVLLAGIAALNASSWLANVHSSGFFASATGLLATARLLALITAFSLVSLSVLIDPPRWIRRTAMIAAWPLLLWALWTIPQGIAVVAVTWPHHLAQGPTTYGSDAVYDLHYNAVLLLQGENPYTGERLTGVVNYFHVIAYTPLARGVFSDLLHVPTAHELHVLYETFARHPSHPPVEIDPRVTHSYPAGSFLLVTPVVWAGATTVTWAFIAAFCAVWLALIVSTPTRWRWLAVCGPLLMVDGLRQVGGGDFEILACALVIGAWLKRDERLLSCALLGIAVATKQTAWLQAPFYLLWIWRSVGRTEALQRLAYVIGFFLLTNLPWIVLSPIQWCSSLLIPYTLPLLPDGVGLVGLAQAGVGVLAPAALYTALEVVAFGALLWIAWRSWKDAPFLGMVIPLAPLLLAWRSPERYFELVPLAALAAFLLTHLALQTPHRQSNPVARERRLER